MKVRSRAVLFTIVLFVASQAYNSPVAAQPATLVRFGPSQGATTFGLAGWNSILKSNNQIFTSQGNDGLITSSDDGEYGDYRGVRGVSRKFDLGERIVVTWYNISEESFYFTARVSFTDDDAPNEADPEKAWFTMRSDSDYRFTFSEIQPHGTAKTVFNITDVGVHKSVGTYSLVNINLAIEWGSTYQKQFLVCEKIELLDDADVAPPSSPTGVSATVLSDSKIRLNWNVSSDNVGVVEYLIYQNGVVEGYSQSNQYTPVFLEPKQEYTFTVTALDAAGNESSHSNSVTASTRSYAGDTDLINPSGFEYIGAFLLPEQFNWGGDALTFNGDGDPGGPNDGYPGSLFVSNLNQPENGLVGETTIPLPKVSPQTNIADLNEATILVPPVNIRPASVNGWGDYVDAWRTGLEYLADERRLYSSWSIYYTVSGEKHAAISCCDATNLSSGVRYGAWHIGESNQPPIDAMLGDWLFATPQPWADANCSGRNLVVGRYREGGLSGLGPTLYAFSKVGANPPAALAELPFTTLLEYGPVEGTDNYHFPNAIDGYKHSDDWREALWLTADDQQAVAIIGNKALGHNWYGYHQEHVRYDWVIADVPYPEFWQYDPVGKGWRAHNRQPMIILYDPDDLASVASGHTMSNEPQPYAALRIPKQIFFGPQHEIFSAANDLQRGILHVTEFVSELDGRLIVHVWSVQSVATSIGAPDVLPTEFQMSQNYPNPFNSITAIRYLLPATSFVELAIYSLLGQKVTTLVAQRQPAGSYTVEWNAAALSSGLYFCRMTDGTNVKIVKLALVK